MLAIKSYEWEVVTHYNSHLQSSRTGSPETGAVFRALPVYRIDSPERLTTPSVARHSTWLTNPTSVAQAKTQTGHKITYSYRSTSPIKCLVFAVESASEALSVRCQGNSCPTPPNAAPQSSRPRSCLDYLRKGSSKCGVYKIYDNNGHSFPVYCDMKTEPGNAWTLVMSWSNKYRGLAPFKSLAFKQNSPVNNNVPNFNLYRQTLSRMQSIKSRSTHWRATCSYPTHGVDYRDYVRGNFKAFDVMTFIGNGACKQVEYVNIRGHMGIHTTARWWQRVNTYTLHIDSSSKGCGFVPVAGAVGSEDNFGFPSSINPNFRCTANDKATTQWWFGGHL
ncbi:hypothetical protein QZH41_002406 [Actinostola sp. cb2023]|nr:hypothetical protein QZH41_002406 [Actinostola sp. cb2023]